MKVLTGRLEIIQYLCGVIKMGITGLGACFSIKGRTVLTKGAEIELQRAEAESGDNEFD